MRPTKMASVLKCVVIMSFVIGRVHSENFHIGAALSSPDKITVLKNYLNTLTTKIIKPADLTFSFSLVTLSENPIRSAKMICEDLIVKKVHTIIASHPPMSPDQSPTSPISVSYTTGYYGIPLIGLSARDSAFSDKNVHSTFLRTVPPYFHQAYVWIDLLNHYDWKQVIFIHGMDEEGRSILSQFQTLAVEHEIKLEKIVKFSVGSNDFRDLLQDLSTCQSRIILLSAGNMVKMTNSLDPDETPHYAASHLDPNCLHRTDDATILFDDATSLNLTSGSEFVWLATQEAFNAKNAPNGILGIDLCNGTKEDAHIMDSLKVIVTTVTKLFNSSSLMLQKTPSDCHTQSHRPWESGQILLKAFKNAELDGETGQLAFNEEGDRLHGVYWIKNINNGSINVVGLHGRYRKNEENILNIDQPIVWPSGSRDKPKGLKISTVLEVVTINSKPFVYTEQIDSEEDFERCDEKRGIYCRHKNLTTQETSTHCCWGYCMDMLKLLANRVNFTFNVHLSTDESFGSFKRIGNSTQKEWTGMVGELVNEEADLAVGPLTINPERALAIDFTKPFKYQGLTILVKKTQKDSSLASFLQPFQDTLWILVGLSVHVVALVLYLLDRFSPFGRFKLAKNEDTEEDALNLSSAMWFAWGVLLNSGIGEGTPRSFSARVLGMVWAGFAMIIVASYTANLAAFLVLDRPDASISGIDDSRLRNPNENFHYATVKDSAVEMYFKRQVELSTMYRKMEELNHKYKTAEEAIKEVKKGNLQAFIWDSSRLEYEDAKDCDLVTAGELFGRSGLGVGLRKGSPWTHQISLAILELHENGEMEKLDNEWILVESTDCPERDHTPATLGLTNMAGVFMMVAGGIVAGVFLIVVEILYKRHRGVKEKELELARNAADRWRGNIAKRRTLRQTMQNQREEQSRVNSLAKMSSMDSNSTIATPISRAATIKQSGSGSLAGQSPPVMKPKVTHQSGRIIAPSASTVMVSNPAFSTANRSDFV